MNSIISIALLVVVAVVGLHAQEEYEARPEYFFLYPVAPEHNELLRVRRSLQPGAPGFPGQPQPTGGNVNYGINREGPNTNVHVSAQHDTPKSSVQGSWSKVIRGPARAKPNWSVGASHRW